MLRFVNAGTTELKGITADPGHNLPGRGAYVHPREACVERAVRRGGLARALRVSVSSAASVAIHPDLQGFLTQAQGKR